MKAKERLEKFTVCYDCFGFKEFDSDFEPERSADYATLWKEVNKFYQFPSRTEREESFSSADCECCGQSICGDAFEYQGYVSV